jgi:hypothetical protein
MQKPIEAQLDLSIKKHCVSYKGNGDLGVYDWLEVAEMYSVSRKWIKLSELQGQCKRLMAFAAGPAASAARQFFFSTGVLLARAHVKQFG